LISPKLFTLFFFIFPQKRPFLGGKGWRMLLLLVFQFLLFQKNYVSKTKKIIFNHISNDFFAIFQEVFQEVVQKHEKKSNCWSLVGFPFVSFHWISKLFRNWATFNYIYKIWNVRCPSPPLPVLTVPIKAWSWEG